MRWKRGPGGRGGTGVIEDVLEALRCPHCGQELAVVVAPDDVGRALMCAGGHSFDVARQGYVSLLPGDAHTGTADTTAMVAAREAFLARGHFDPIAERVASAAMRAADGLEGVVIEVGAGTGYYLAHALNALDGLDGLGPRAGLALDISKHAARRAARAHPRIGVLVCDVWRELPVAPASAAVVLDVFAPRNAAEMARVLVAGGALVVVTPTPRHLSQLVAGGGMLTVDERKAERLETSVGGWFELAGEESCEYTVAMSDEDVAAAEAMGPGAYHARPDADPTASGQRDVTVSVRIGTYRVRLRPQVNA